MATAQEPAAGAGSASGAARGAGEGSRDVALVAEACAKAGLLWLELPEAGRAVPAWHVWHDGAAYVVGGGQEQPLPGLAAAFAAGRDVRVTVPSKDRGGRLVIWLARPTPVLPGTPEWEVAVGVLSAARLNAADGTDQASRWARESTVARLEPTGELVEGPGRMSTGSGAAAPPPTPAATPARLPFVLGRRRGRRDRRRDR